MSYKQDIYDTGLFCIFSVIWNFSEKYDKTFLL